MEQSFSVALVSNECEDFFPENTNFLFANSFPKHLNLAGYEVALTSITYYDRFIRDTGPVLAPPSPPKPVPPKNFFDISKNEHKFIVEKLQFIDTAITKNNETNFVAFIGHVNDICFKFKLSITFTLKSENGEVKAVVARVNAPTGFHIQLTEEFASLLGFPTNVFENGTFVAPSAPDYETFDSLSPTAHVGSIYLTRRESVELELRQIRARPNLTTIINNIIMTLHKAGYEVDIQLSKSTQSLVWERLGDIRIQFSEFLNSYLGQAKNFIFAGDGSFVVPEEIIVPKKPVDDIPEPAPPPKVSCNKLLVTCSIIKDQWYAGRAVKLISLIERKETSEFTRINYIPQNLIYKELEKEFVSQIQVGLKSDNSFLPSYEQPTVCTLHFRKRFTDL